jgi:hypothetical protein
LSIGENAKTSKGLADRALEGAGSLYSASFLERNFPETSFRYLPFSETELLRVELE